MKTRIPPGSEESRESRSTGACPVSLKRAGDWGGGQIRGDISALAELARLLDGKPCLYLVFPDNLRHREHGVGAVRAGLAADRAQQSPVLLAENLQGLPVPLASFLLLLASSQGFPTAQPPGDLQHPRQLPARAEAPLRGRVPAPRAREPRRGPFPAALDARAAEVVAAVDGHGVPEIFQANGAGGLARERVHGAPGDAGAAAFIFSRTGEGVAFLPLAGGGMRSPAGVGMEKWAMAKILLVGPLWWS